ncbi:MAG: hypothetical protein JXA93_17760 [Anaerolineae bacterium]|nr:hypothetical protein [Anaerolineae bacterium]
MTAEYNVPVPQGHALMERGNTAARYAARRIENLIVLPQDLEDMTQEAAITYYETMDRTGDDGIAFYGAMRAAHRCYMRQCVGRNPFGDSLDRPTCYGRERQEYSRLDVMEHGDKSSWLSHADLLALVKEVGGYKRPLRDTYENDAKVLRLLLEGYDNAAIAVTLGWKEQQVKSKRRRLKDNLKAYCEREGIPLPEWGPGGWRQSHDYGLSGKRQGRRQQ